ncbi:MAG: hypothetical protein ACK4S4_02895 [Pyrinomonadaceae bacterium]
MKQAILLFTVSLALAAVAAAQSSEPAKPAASAAAAPTPSKLPTAAEILNKYVAAIGGRDANLKIRSWQMSGTVEFAPMGLKGTFETLSAAPDRSVMHMTISGLGSIAQGFDGKTAWSISPLDGMRELSGIELQQIKSASSFYRLVNLAQNSEKYTVAGPEKLGDKQAYVVTLPAEAEGLFPTKMYFDTVSGHLLRMDATQVGPQGNIPTTTYFDEMKLVDGVYIPVRSRTTFGPAELVTVVTVAKSNVAVDDAKFAKPKQ